MEKRNLNAGIQKRAEVQSMIETYNKKVDLIDDEIETDSYVILRRTERTS